MLALCGRGESERGLVSSGGSFRKRSWKSGEGNVHGSDRLHQKQGTKERPVSVRANSNYRPPLDEEGEVMGEQKAPSYSSPSPYP